LSEGGRRFDPDRIGYDFNNGQMQLITAKKTSTKKDKQDKEEKEEIDLVGNIDAILKCCTISDVEGLCLLLAKVTKLSSVNP
jgi:non-homologous end joining protein Ku